MPRSKATRRLRADEHAFLSRHAGQRELVGVQEAGRDGASQAVGKLAVRLLRHREIAAEQLFDRTQDVAAAATQAQKQNIHFLPLCSGQMSKWHAMTTHLPRPLSWPSTIR